MILTQADGTTKSVDVRTLTPADKFVKVELTVEDLVLLAAGETARLTYFVKQMLENCSGE